MKILVLILACSCVAMGQTVDTSKDVTGRLYGGHSMLSPEMVFLRDNSYYPRLTFKNWTVPDKQVDYLPAALLHFYDRYAKECYDDSNKVWENTRKAEGRPELTVYYPPIMEWVWHHRQPTFEGFIEYLRKQK